MNASGTTENVELTLDAACSLVRSSVQREFHLEVGGDMRLSPIEKDALEQAPHRRHCNPFHRRRWAGRSESAMKTKSSHGKKATGKQGTVYPVNIGRMEQYLQQTRTEYVTRTKRAETEPGGALAGPTARPRTAR